MIFDFILRILVCFILSFLIGLERQWRRKTIGLRTNVLVCLGAFLFVSLSVRLNSSDPTRIAAQVVSGIGFLGAGVILKDGANIRGLNTAATLWCNAAIGVLCAFGLLTEAIVGTIFILLSNLLLRYIGFNLMKQTKEEKELYQLKLVCSDNKEQAIRAILIQAIHKQGLVVIKMDSIDIDSNKTKIKIELQAQDRNLVEKIVNQFSMEPDIFSITFKPMSEDIEKALEIDEV